MAFKKKCFDNFDNVLRVGCDFYMCNKKKKSFIF